MLKEDLLIGDPVYIFSERLNEVIKGFIEGFNEDRTRVKILQNTTDGLIRHVVSWVYVFSSKEEAESAASDYRIVVLESKEYSLGSTVHLKQAGDLVRDLEGNPYIYQIVRVYQDKKRVSLVNSYGESIGTFSIKDIEYFSSEPIFKSSDYCVGQVVNWIEYEDVYEGVIDRLKENTAEISNIKKLMPLDLKKNLPYYKIQSDDLYNNKVLTSIVGDEIDSE